MAAVSKSESLLYKDARSYCARRHMNTMWKTMRVDRRFDSLLDKKLYYLEKSRSYRARQLDQEQELFLENLTGLFERQCEIAADKLEVQIGDHLIKDQHNSAEARLRGSRRKSIKRMRSFTMPIHNVLTDSELHVVPGCEHERPAPQEKSTLGENFRVSSAQSFGRQSRQNFLRGFEDQLDGKRSACCGHENEEKGVKGRRRDAARSFKNESMSLEPSRRPPSRKKSGTSRPGTSASGRQSVTWGKGSSLRPKMNKVAPAPAAPAKKPTSWSIIKDNVFHKREPSPYKPLSATKRDRCSKCEPTIAWEIVPRSNRLKNNRKGPSASNQLQSTVFQPGQRDQTTDEETLFRKQFLACAMSRFLPISALRGSSFGEHDDVRKKMEGRRRCLEELKQRHLGQLQSAPKPTSMFSRLSHEDTTTRASSSYTKTPMNDSSKNETPGDGNFFNF